MFPQSQTTQIIIKPYHLTFIIWNGDFEGFGQNAADKSLLRIQRESTCFKSWKSEIVQDSKSKMHFKNSFLPSASI